MASRIFSKAKRIFSALRRAASSAATTVEEPVDDAFDPELFEEASVRAALAPDDAELSLESIEMLSENAESLSGLSVLIPVERRNRQEIASPFLSFEIRYSPETVLLVESVESGVKSIRNLLVA